ncbi:MAG: hypothetical protein AABN34_11380 [Acidobacteriota bacterium]
MGEKWTPEHDRAADELKDQADAGYKPDTMNNQIEANRDNDLDALKHGDYRPGGPPEGEA